MRGTLAGALLFSFCVSTLLSADPPAGKSTREVLQGFNALIGSWQGTGTPSGTRAEQQRGFWTERIAWKWHFKDNDAWLDVTFTGSKHFTQGTLRFVPADDTLKFAVETPGKKTLTFTGRLKDHVLTLQKRDEGKKEKQQLVFTLLHENRFLYRYEIKPDARPFFTRVFQVGAKKEGVAFAAGDGRPECVVSGGLGTMAVVYKGTTYYVCCSGCRDEFKANPEKYIKESEERKAKAGK
jgi:YHS domain